MDQRSYNIVQFNRFISMENNFFIQRTGGRNFAAEGGGLEIFRSCQIFSRFILTPWSSIGQMNSFVTRFRCNLGHPNVASHICSNLPKYERSLISQLRLGILPIRIETVRYSNLPVPEQQRICLSCDSNQVANELHFLFHCHLYDVE